MQDYSIPLSALASRIQKIDFAAEEAAIEQAADNRQELEAAFERAKSELSDCALSLKGAEGVQVSPRAAADAYLEGGSSAELNVDALRARHEDLRIVVKGLDKKISDMKMASREAIKAKLAKLGEAANPFVDGIMVEAVAKLGGLAELRAMLEIVGRVTRSRAAERLADTIREIEGAARAFEFAVPPNGEIESEVRAHLQTADRIITAAFGQRGSGSDTGSKRATPRLSWSERRAIAHAERSQKPAKKATPFRNVPSGPIRISKI